MDIEVSLIPKVNEKAQQILVFKRTRVSLILREISTLLILFDSIYFSHYLTMHLIFSYKSFFFSLLIMNRRRRTSSRAHKNF